MNGSRLLTALLAVAVVAGTPTLGFAKDACKDVKFKYVNHHDGHRRIRIKKVRFWNTHANKTQTEDVRNHECAFGSTCITGGDNLNNADEVNLTSIRIVYQEWQTDHTWSRAFESQRLIPASQRCREGTTYELIEVLGAPRDPLG